MMSAGFVVAAAVLQPLDVATCALSAGAAACLKHQNQAEIQLIVAAVEAQKHYFEGPTAAADVNSYFADQSTVAVAAACLKDYSVG